MIIQKCIYYCMFESGVQRRHVNSVMLQNVHINIVWSCNHWSFNRFKKSILSVCYLQEKKGLQVGRSYWTLICPHGVLDASPRSKFQTCPVYNHWPTPAEPRHLICLWIVAQRPFSQEWDYKWGLCIQLPIILCYLIVIWNSQSPKPATKPLPVMDIPPPFFSKIKINFSFTTCHELNL
jgi:hypothetical protein